MNFSRSSKEVSQWENIYKNLIICHVTLKYDVATEERKMDRFLGGLNPQLRCALSMFDFPDFQTLVNKDFIAEREHKLVSDTKSAHNDHKRKFEPKKEMQLVQKVRT